MPKIFQIENAKELFFADKEEYLALRATWKALAQAKTLSASDMAAYALLRGKDLRKAFSPITNPNKLANGQAAGQGLDQAYATVRRASQYWPSALPSNTPALLKLSVYLADKESAQ